MNTDVLIVGSGCSGLYCALKLPRDIRITLITKSDLESNDSFLAQGGMCMLKEQSDFDSFFEDTLKAGHYENDKESVGIMINSSPEVVKDLVSYGADFARNDDGSLAVEATDDYTLKITLTNPCPYFNDLMAFPTYFPVYQKDVEKADPDGKNPGKWCQEAGFVSNGAYTLKSWKHNESMVYVKNPKYYDADNVTMDEIHIMLSADDTATYAAYNSGDLDFVDTVPNDEISTLNGKNSDFHIIPNLGTYYVGFNVNDPIFDGKTVEQAASMRKAMNLLIDREFIVENVGQTGQIAADSFVPAGMSDGNGGVFKTDDTSYYDADKTGADQVEEAKKLLESAGYTFTDNGDGSYKCDPAISMTFLTNDDSTHIAVGESLQQDFALLGINMEIKSEDWNVFIEDRKSGNFTIAREGWLADYNDPINMLELFTTDSGNNDMQLGKGDKPSDSAPDWTDYNKLIKEIRTSADFSKRVDLMHQAEDMLMDTGAVMPILLLQ